MLVQGTLAGCAPGTEDRKRRCRGLRPRRLRPASVLLQHKLGAHAGSLSKKEGAREGLVRPNGGGMPAGLLLDYRCGLPACLRCAPTAPLIANSGPCRSQPELKRHSNSAFKPPAPRSIWWHPAAEARSRCRPSQRQPALLQPPPRPSAIRHGGREEVVVEDQLSQRVSGVVRLLGCEGRARARSTS